MSLLWPVLLARGGLLIAWFWGGLCCCRAAQGGEAVEEEVEEGRGGSGDEADGPLGFSFSIMLVKSQGESLAPSVSLFMSLYVY